MKLIAFPVTVGTIVMTHRKLDVKNLERYTTSDIQELIDTSGQVLFRV